VKKKKEEEKEEEGGSRTRRRRMRTGQNVSRQIPRRLLIKYSPTFFCRGPIPLSLIFCCIYLSRFMRPNHNLLK